MLKNEDTNLAKPVRREAGGARVAFEKYGHRVSRPFALRAWASLDADGALVGESTVPKIVLTQEELRERVRALARACDLLRSTSAGALSLPGRQVSDPSGDHEAVRHLDESRDCGIPAGPTEE